jgi:hypothetical protein
VVSDIQVHEIDHRGQLVVYSAAKKLEESVCETGKELFPTPDGNPLFLFLGAKGKTRSPNAFLDIGSSDVLM